jgi:hypothetical protein
MATLLSGKVLNKAATDAGLFGFPELGDIEIAVQMSKRAGLTSLL